MAVRILFCSASHVVLLGTRSTRSTVNDIDYA